MMGTAFLLRAHVWRLLRLSVANPDRAATWQVLVYFAVAKLGEKPIDGVTDLNPEGLTAATGKHAAAFAARLAAGGLSCKVRVV